jgi:SAM-dependent methyltransferase
MTFYTDIAVAYDSIFPPNPQQIQFIGQCFNSKASLKLLDVGCGTGNLSLALTALNHELIGIDLDEAMINRAREKDNEKRTVFEVCNMLTLQQYYPAQSFDGIVCFGNTLVHLPDLKAMSTFFNQARILLKPGGKLLLQIINYDRIIKQSINHLPTIENDDVQFIRNYNYLKERHRIDFETFLSFKNNRQTIKNSQILYPLTRSELNDLLIASGFIDLTFFGSFTRQPWLLDSIPCVVQASVK